MKNKITEPVGGGRVGRGPKRYNQFYCTGGGDTHFYDQCGGDRHDAMQPYL